MESVFSDMLGKAFPVPRLSTHAYVCGFVSFHLVSYLNHLKYMNSKTVETLHTSKKTLQTEQNIAITQCYELL